MSPSRFPPGPGAGRGQEAAGAGGVGAGAGGARPACVQHLARVMDGARCRGGLTRSQCSPGLSFGLCCPRRSQEAAPGRAPRLGAGEGPRRALGGHGDPGTCAGGALAARTSSARPV